jgi:hypothetical protein
VLAGCAAKQKAVSAQPVSAQDEKDRIACLDETSKESFDEKAFAACLRAKGYNLTNTTPAAATVPAVTTTPIATTSPPAPKSLAADGLNRMVRESSPGLAASDEYDRAVANYNNCLLEHTANVSACEEQRAIMNADGRGLSKPALKSSLSRSDKIINVEHQ